ncbi:MarR family winged helix-turn-helix transcriptional regulator [Curtobacterium sp. SP.BCo]|uniref:MarR family winged helix-turn-helix transcriptional regulator n=1 Tax=Curtobacterium sp. SP.BCo TaxID=3435229 RepID=UPI003F73A133
MAEQQAPEPSALLAAFDAVVRAQTSLTAELSRRAGIHDSALRTLVLLSETGYATPTEVAGYLGLTSGAVTNTTDRLVDAGLVERRRNPADRRGSLLELTAAGADLIADRQARYAAALRSVDAAHDGRLLPVLEDLANTLLIGAVDAHADTPTD